MPVRVPAAPYAAPVVTGADPSVQAALNSMAREISALRAALQLESGSMANTVTAAAPFGTDNAVLRSDGTGRGTQGSLASIDDAGIMILTAGGQTFTFDASVGLMSSSAGFEADALGGDINFLQFTTGGSVNFYKLVDDAGGAADTFRFRRTSVFAAANRHTTWEIDDVPKTFMNQACRVSKADEKFALYMDTNARWQQVDGLPGGRFSFTDAGTTEPIT